jgi:release factor glutamine methyltransferase
MTIKEALKQFQAIEIDLLLSHILGKPKEFLFVNRGHRLSRKEANRLTQIVNRRMAGEPIAYILGYKDFAGLRFKVNKNVLIPRPESEWLVERVVEGYELRVTGSNIRILDLGTGSGCLAISVVAQLATRNSQPNNCIITASDISPAALEVAKQNAKKYNAKIKFIKSDLFQNISGKFDIIIGNLPYVPMKMLNKFMLGKQKFEAHDPFAGLKFEPISALTDGTLSFQIYRRFFEQVGGHVNKGGLILLEIDPSSKKFLIEYQQKNLPSGRLKFYKDYNGLLRYAEITL